MVIHSHFDEEQTRPDSLFSLIADRIAININGRKKRPMGRKSDYGNGIFKQLEEVMGRLDLVEESFKAEKREHRADVNRLNDEITDLKKAIEEKDRRIEILTNDNERLKRIINNDSSNSSLPPSSDQNHKRPNEYNGRQKSGKKVGAQPGHKGVTLTKEDALEKLSSGKFKHMVTSLGNESGNTYITKYVMDIEIVPVITEIRIYAGEDGKFNIPTEYKSDVTYGNTIKSIVVDLYAEGVVSNDRICGFINAISGNLISLSTGSVYGFIKSFAERSGPSVGQIEEGLLNAKTVCTDATTVKINGVQGYIRNFSTQGLVLYKSMEKKNLDCLKAIEFLMNFTGALEHDHETALYHFGTAHGECNVHLLRYLKKNIEEAMTHWGSEMASLLIEINNERKQRMARDKLFTDEEISAYKKRYDDIIANGRLQNKATKGKLAKQEENALLNRLVKYKENHLLFVSDFSVPFENNISERDLRKCKNRQKMSGGFRKYSGSEMYCRIMSIVETCKRKEMQIIGSIKKIFEGSASIF